MVDNQDHGGMAPAKPYTLCTHCSYPGGLIAPGTHKHWENSELLALQQGEKTTNQLTNQQANSCHF